MYHIINTNDNNNDSNSDNDNHDSTCVARARRSSALTEAALKRFEARLEGKHKLLLNELQLINTLINILLLNR